VIILGQDTACFSVHPKNSVELYAY